MIDEILNGYLQCALWSSLNEDGVPLDYLFEVDDIPKNEIEKCKDKCLEFYNKAKEYLVNISDFSQVGHDFWLTSNGHGSGFWDNVNIYDGNELSLFSQQNDELPSKRLTIISHSLGGSTLYVGKDGNLYFS